MPSAVSDNSDSSQTIWYLAYGSNMDPKVFSGRRKIQPIESINVGVPNYWLSFDIAGIPFVEPCFASILKMNHARLHDKEYAREVHDKTLFGQEFVWDESHPEHPQRSYPPVLQGVAHKITLHEWQMVIQSEGGWGHDVPSGYNQIVVECIVSNTKERISAHVLEARPFSVKPQCQPSLRYKNLLTAGAAHHNIDTTYQQYLARIVPYECVGIRQKIGRVVYMAINTPMILFFMLIVLRNKGKPPAQHTPPPYWAAWFVDKAGWFSSKIHDYIVGPVFGSGRHASPAHRLASRIKIEEELKKDKTLQEHQKCMEAEADREGAALKMAEQAAETLAE